MYDVGRWTFNLGELDRYIDLLTYVITMLFWHSEVSGVPSVKNSSR